MTRAVFLPGAGGRRDFWAPVAVRLDFELEPLLLGWPGFGDEPFDPRIQGVPDLVDFVLDRIDEPVDLVAQSMGGVVALLLTLRRPDLVQRLVLCGTSGGLDLTRFAAEDWREGYEDDDLPEQTPRWFLEDRSDLSDAIPSVRTPTLLLWGDRDDISPPAVGEHLCRQLPDARLQLIAGGGHSFAIEQPEAAAVAIGAFLTQTQPALDAARWA